MANKVTIDIEAQFADHVSGKTKAASSALKDLEKNAKAATKEVDNLGKKKAEPKLNADNSKLVKKVNDSTSKLKKLGNTEATAKVSVLDKVTRVVSKITGALKAYGGKSYNAVVNVKSDPALNALKKVSRAGEKIAGKTWSAAVKIKDLATAPLRGIKNMLFSIKTLAATIVAGVAAKKIVAEPLQVADNYSSAKIGFSTLLGESAGQKMMDDLDAFAKKTPFDTTGVIDSARKMMAMGWDSENLLGDLEVFGNAAAATGNLNQGLESIVRAMSQIKTKGRLSTEELNQLAEAGIAAKAMLAENLGYGTGDEGIAKMTKDLEDGAIASNVAIEALIAGMKKYDGMMDSMANETAGGLWSQIKDTFSINVVRKWGQGLQDGAKRGLGAVVDLLDEAEEAMSGLGDMMYEVGEKASNWLADRFENAIKRITDITGTFEFQNASLGEKISMLWDGVIVDPLSEWWEGGGQQKTAETAGKIGSWMGKAITSGLLTLFGITDILDDETAKQLGEEGGMSIAQSFAQGFKDNFDGSAITEAFVDAIGDVWNALPTWAKFLIGGYGVAKIGGGISSLAGGLVSGIDTVKDIIGSSGTIGEGNVIVGASGLRGLIGKTGIYGTAGTGILGGLSKLGYGASAKTAALLGSTKGGAALLGVGGGTAALAGAGTLAAGASVIKGGYDLYRGYTTDDEVEAKASKASGWTTLGGVGAGAAIGTAILPGVGTLIGAGIGGIAGWLGGDAWADNIRETAANAEYANKKLAESAAAVAKGEKSAEELNKELEKYKWDKARECFGDISLSMEEIARLSKQVVFGDDLPKYEKFTAATKQVEASLQALNAAGEQTDRWMWKVGLGVKFNEDEVESIKASFDEYINSAKNYVEDKHYEFTASAELLLNLESEEGKAILEGGNAYYAQIQEELNTAGDELGSLLTDALADGFINADESAAIAAAQKKIADITKKIADAESDAELTLIDLKFGGGKLDADSFDSFMEAVQSTLDEKLSSADAAVQAQIANLNLQFPTDDDKKSQEYKDKLQTILDAYNLEVESVTADILGVELNIIGDSFSGEDMLGEDAVSDLQNILQTCLDEGIEPIDMDLNRLIQLSGNPELGTENAGLVQDYLQGVFDQLDLSQFELIEVDGKLQVKLKPEVETEGDVTEKVQESVPPYLGTTTTLGVTAEKQVSPVELLAEEFGVTPETAVSTILKVNAANKICDKVEILKEDFGIDSEYAWDLLLKLTGNPDYNDIPDPTLPSWGLQESYSYTIPISITGVPSFNGFSLPTVNADGEGYRGGIFGGPSAMDAFARGGETDNSGIVGGSTRFIRVNEESPEMIIPLSSQRRERALKLWNKTGELLGVPGFARGGRSDGDNDEGIRFFNSGREDASGGQTVEIDVGGIHVEINVDATGTENIAEAIKKQGNEIAEVVAGIMADAIGGQYENTPLRGGIA